MKCRHSTNGHVSFHDTLRNPDPDRLISATFLNLEPIPRWTLIPSISDSVFCGHGIDSFFHFGLQIKCDSSIVTALSVNLDADIILYLILLSGDWSFSFSLNLRSEVRQRPIIRSCRRALHPVWIRYFMLHTDTDSVTISYWSIATGAVIFNPNWGLIWNLNKLVSQWKLRASWNHP